MKLKISASQFIEYYTAILTIIGLPIVGYMFWGIEIAIAVFIVVQIALGYAVIRKT